MLDRLGPVNVAATMRSRSRSACWGVAGKPPRRTTTTVYTTTPHDSRKVRA